MFDDDICLCANNEHCPQKDYCKRAIHKVGIHTVSNLYNSNEEKCEYFIKRSDINVK